MKKRHVQWTVGLVLIVAGGVLLAQSQAIYREMRQNGPNGWHGHRGMLMGRLTRELNLTDAQQAQIKTLRQQQRPVIQPLLQHLAANHQEMLAATAKGSFDEAKVRSIANQQGQIMAQLLVARQETMSKIYNTVLTSEQKAKFDQLRQNMANRIEQRIQKGPTAKR